VKALAEWLIKTSVGAKAPGSEKKKRNALAGGGGEKEGGLAFKPPVGT